MFKRNNQYYKIFLFILLLSIVYFIIKSYYMKIELNYMRIEQTAELIYRQQLTRIEGQIEVEEFKNIHINYPCLYGTIPVGDKSTQSIKDGHKYLCGVNKIKGSPIIYSYGSSQNQIFELSLLSLRPDSKIYIFDVDESLLPPPSVRDSRINYIATALGGYHIKSGNAKTLQEQMILHGHNYIDILKMDIEASEYDFIKYESHLLDRIGQLSVELHINNEVRDWYPPLNSTLVTKFVQQVESRGLRLFYKEINRLVQDCCSEFSFIQQNWFQFEKNKSLFKRLSPIQY